MTRLQFLGGCCGYEISLEMDREKKMESNKKENGRIVKCQFHKNDRNLEPTVPADKTTLHTTYARPLPILSVRGICLDIQNQEVLSHPSHTIGRAN